MDFRSLSAWIIRYYSLGTRKNLTGENAPVPFLNNV